MSAGGSRTVIYAALIGNLLITIIKFIVAMITRSTAMLAESLHSLADTGNQGLLLFGIRRSQRPASEEHPFGHGKEQFFWSFVVANMLFFLGAVFSIYEGINKIIHPHPMEKVYLIYLILGASIIIEAISFSVAFRQFLKGKGERGIMEALQESKDPTLVVVLVEDTAALVGLTIAFLGVFLVDITGKLYWDSIASILIGVVLAVVAAFLANEMRNLLVGEGMSGSDVRRIREAVEGFGEVEAVGGIYSMYLGPEEVLLALEVDFKDQLSCGTLESTVGKIGGRIKEVAPFVKQVFIHAESLSKPKLNP